MSMPSIVKKAKLYGISSHVDQKYGPFPYGFHLYDVVAVAHRFGFEDPIILAACWLHDTIEDTETTYEELVEKFGQEIADIVLAVSKNGVGNRKAQNTECYGRTAKNFKAIIVKLCDRIANVESGEKNDMYRKEHLDFVRILTSVNHEAGNLSPLFLHLHDLLWP
jgi:(p)ppGpp synthase/HD superfamily hydrolase